MFHLTQAQRLILQHPAKNKVLVAGRRWGKSTILEALFAKFGLAYPRFKSELIGPKYKTAMDVYSQLMREDRGYKKLVHHTKVQPVPTIYLHNGHETSFRSLEHPETCKGSGYVLCATDESSNMRWKHIEEVLQPKVFDLNGTMFYTGTLKGESGWLYKKYLEGQTWPNKTDTMSWLFPTKTNLLRFGGPEGEARFEAERLKYSEETFNQEFLCIPTANQSAVFKSKWLQPCISGVKRPIDVKRRDGYFYVAGLDLGRAKDHTVLVVLEWSKGEQKARVVEVERWDDRDISYEVIASSAANICKLWNASCVVDVTGGAQGGHGGKDHFHDHTDHFRKKLPQMMAFTWGQANKLGVIEELNIAIQGRQIEFYRQDAQLISELELYEWKSEEDSDLTAGAPKGFHDDCVAALMQAFHGIKKNFFRDPNGVHAAYGFH